MSKACPIYGKAIYMDCIECEDKQCKKSKTKIVIGIDQSYKNTGISICKNGVLTDIKSVHLEAQINNSRKRKYLYNKIYRLFDKVSQIVKMEPSEVIIIIERIRLRSQGFINIDYIKSIGALNSVIVDCAKEFNFPVYNVDTRAWKSAIVGTSKPQSNKYGINPEKWPTIQFICRMGYEKKILVEVNGRKKNGVFERDGKRYTYNDDAADSACIALYGFLPKTKQKLEPEH